MTWATRENLKDKVIQYAILWHLYVSETTSTENISNQP